MQSVMNYRLRRQGADLGTFSLEELRRRRQAGELAGNEYVQAEGKDDWQPLDLVLEQGYRVTPPPLPSSFARRGRGARWLWVLIPVGAILFMGLVIGLGLVADKSFRRGFVSAFNQARYRGMESKEAGRALAVASQPITWTSHTLTVAGVRKRDRQFITRQWLEGYEQRGAHNPATDATVRQFIRAWIDTNFGGPTATNSSWLQAEGSRLAANSNCADPLALTVTALTCIELHESTVRLERALKAFPGSKHRAYPRFYATLALAGDLEDEPARATVLYDSALKLYRQCLADGSFTAQDQPHLGEFFVHQWASRFFERNGEEICEITRQAGPDYKWLALTLGGQKEINDAWKARGNGYADSVTATGWRLFGLDLAQARTALTAAWGLHPDWPLAPEQMMEVCLGDSNIGEMRTWFDRALAGQIDYPRAWSEFQWGLRPRWYGSHAAMLALGKTAVNSGRFDTQVPYAFFQSVSAVESELGLPLGHHIYGHANIWPTFERMYQGYIAKGASAQRSGWRSAYAVVAYLAGHYHTARAQLEALNWKPQAENLAGWGEDLSLMPLEVAARTGPSAKEIADAETKYHNGDVPGALEAYRALKSSGVADELTAQFMAHRLASLELEQRLQKGQWVDFLPDGDLHPNWVFLRGHARRLPDGALQVRCGPDGHFLYSRVRVGPNFEVKGQFEVIHSSSTSFEGGLIMGTPDLESYNWEAFRMKQNRAEGDVVCFARGWTKRQIYRPALLNSGTNTFDFILQNGAVTASVNGESLFQQAAPPSKIYTPANAFYLGLGAFNDSNSTVIRYRNLRVRELD
jgi:hypothetical protein